MQTFHSLSWLHSPSSLIKVLQEEYDIIYLMMYCLGLRLTMLNFTNLIEEIKIYIKTSLIIHQSFIHYSMHIGSVSLDITVIDIYLRKSPTMTEICSRTLMYIFAKNMVTMFNGHSFLQLRFKFGSIYPILPLTNKCTDLCVHFQSFLRFQSLGVPDSLPLIEFRFRNER